MELRALLLTRASSAAAESGVKRSPRLDLSLLLLLVPLPLPLLLPLLPLLLLLLASSSAVVVLTVPPDRKEAASPSPGAAWQETQRLHQAGCAATGAVLSRARGRAALRPRLKVGGLLPTRLQHLM